MASKIDAYARVAAFAAGCTFTGCYDGSDVEQEQDLRACNEAQGCVNGSYCEDSPYNCTLKPGGGEPRVIYSSSGGPDRYNWGVAPFAPVLDGNGRKISEHLAISAAEGKLVFNYGQVRVFNGERHAFTKGTASGTTGWIPISKLSHQTLFDKRVGKVSAQGKDLEKMGCYAVRKEQNAELARLIAVPKYVNDALLPLAEDYLQSAGSMEEPGLINLVFNLPGGKLGGAAVDRFPVGTKFQRLRVPTYASNGRLPSIKRRLYKIVNKQTGAEVIGVDRLDDSMQLVDAGKTLTFVYGYVVAETNTKRNGWIPFEALEPSTKCPGSASTRADDPEPEPGVPEPTPEPAPEPQDPADPVPEDPNVPDPTPPEPLPEPEPEPEPPAPQPEPEPMPTPMPTPPVNYCVATCCDGTVQGPADTADAQLCIDTSQGWCEGHEHILRADLNGQLVWQRANSCWAKCYNRVDYHLVNVQQDCTVHAKGYCAEGDRGGLEDAAWSQCQP